MNLLQSRINHFKKFYPYEKCSLRLKISAVFRAGIIKILNRFVYPRVSLLNEMKKIYGIKNNKEFLAGYRKMKEGFDDELWESKPRNTKEEIEGFYNEQENDIWRQIYLSEYDRDKKNYVLRVYGLISHFYKNKNTKIIDYGCGCGIFGNYLYEKGYKDITLADIKSKTLKFIQKAFGSKFKYTEINNGAPLKENYDIILLIDVLAHAFNPLETIRHIIDRLNGGGLLVMNYEKGVFRTHLKRAAEQREKTMNYIYDRCNCLKEDEIFVKK
jgi:2-polyprenyl-3-methyl-5-hydroxy-6-metoxy-1,4-benzoquinol methylase